MPSKEVDSSTEDDDSIILEGGKHMYWHDFVLCYDFVLCFSYVEYFYTRFSLSGENRVPSRLCNTPSKTRLFDLVFF
jgi:hypothetical protein